MLNLKLNVKHQCLKYISEKFKTISNSFWCSVVTEYSNTCHKEREVLYFKLSNEVNKKLESQLIRHIFIFTMPLLFDARLY